MERRGLIFCMRFADDQGFVWRTVARLRDLVATHLDGFDCYIAFPELTGQSVHHFTTLVPVALDCYDFSPANKARIKSFVAEKDVAALIYMSALATTLDMKFLKSLGVATINTEEDSFDHRKKDNMVVSAAKYVVRHILHRQIHDLHIANAASQGTWLNHYSKIPAARITVIPNGIDCIKFSPPGRPPADDAVQPLESRYRWILCVSQARSEKRVDMIIRAAAEILKSEEFADTAFVYVGDGQMRPAWEELAASLGLADRFHFAGEQSDLAPYYRAAYVMVHAAERESFGLVLAEAMACGLPVIASAAAGPSEIIDDGVTGRLIGLDDETAFQQAIIAYLRDPALQACHGKAARARATSLFSIHRQAEQLATAIKATVGAR